MKNIWILAKANLRKSKSQTFSVGLLVLVVAMLLNIGLVMFFDVGSFFEQRAEELNSPHFVAIHHKYGSQGEELEFILNFPEVTEVETTSVIFGMGGVHLGETFSTSAIIIAPQDYRQTMNPPSLIGNYLPLGGNSVYVPHFMILQGNFDLGDEIRVEILGEELTFTIAGGTEEIMYGDGMIDAGWRLYVHEDKFAYLSEDFPDALSYMHSVRMTGGYRILSADYRAEFQPAFGGSQAANIGAAQNNRTFVAVMAALIVATFALILLVIGSIVVRFRISNDIEEGMTNIGVLKATGYVSRQIKLSILLQFGIIALVGTVVGVLISQILLPLIAGLLEPLIGLPWNPAFNLLAMLISFGIILLMVLLFTVVTTRRISKLHPLIALRGGVNTHNFRKNHLPLDKTGGSLSFLLAVKQIFQNARQSISVFLIIAMLAAVSVSGIILNYNANVNMTAFLHLVAGEIPDYVAMMREPITEEDKARMSAHPDIEMIVGNQTMNLVVGGITTVSTIVEDFEYFGGHSLISGRMPRLPSEIVVESRLLTEIGSSIGDFIPVRSGDNEEYFMVTGAIQVFGNQFNIEMSIDGLHRIQPDFAFVDYFVYLVEGATIDGLLEEERYIIQSVISIADEADAVFGTMGDILAMVTVAILVVVAGIVVLVLYLMVKTIIIRRRRELGTQKALGFTTPQLMNQIALGMTPAVLIGAGAGTVLGYVGFNPLFSLLLYSNGVAQSNLFVPLGGSIAVAVGLVVLAYIVSMLIAWRIRKISAYALVSE